jgi:hypothetical protein
VHEDNFELTRGVPQCGLAVHILKKRILRPKKNYRNSKYFTIAKKKKKSSKKSFKKKPKSLKIL